MKPADKAFDSEFIYSGGQSVQPLQTDAETRRQDTPVSTLGWAKSPSLTNSSRTIDSSYDNRRPPPSSPPNPVTGRGTSRREGLRMEDRGPRRGGVIYDSRRRQSCPRAAAAATAARPSCRISLARPACLPAPPPACLSVLLPASICAVWRATAGTG